MSAEVADRVDYYFIYGPDADQIIGRYRELTGEAPLFGRWAYGFWQCKNKYQSQEEIEGVAAKYRALHIPVDNIVQDWFWWVTMGEMKWNPNYPDPQGMINKLHDEHFHLMVSVWPYFRPGSATYDEFDKNGWFMAKTMTGVSIRVGQALYDPTNPDARTQYWANINTALFQKGVDAWWLDTDEPETEGQRGQHPRQPQTAYRARARVMRISIRSSTRRASQKDSRKPRTKSASLSCRARPMREHSGWA